MKWLKYFLIFIYQKHIISIRDMIGHSNISIRVLKELSILIRFFYVWDSIYKTI